MISRLKRQCLRVCEDFGFSTSFSDSNVAQWEVTKAFHSDEKLISKLMI